MMKKEWKKPELEVLDISMTMSNGKGHSNGNNNGEVIIMAMHQVTVYDTGDLVHGQGNAKWIWSPDNAQL